ncbi:unnamed protein product [Merluccius merluccius]
MDTETWQTRTQQGPTRTRQGPDQQSPTLQGPTRTRRGSVVLLSSVCSALVVLAAGVLCALVYPIFTGFWSVLVLSGFAGCFCCASSWTLTYLDSYTPGAHLAFLPRPRRAPGRSSRLGYGVALLNGFMASLAVAWTLR